MTLLELEKLITSLSPAEKKSFKLNSTKYDGEKDYILLFDIISNGEYKDLNDIEEKFAKESKSKSFDNTANYLFKTLTDLLVSIRIGQDNWFIRHHSLMKARLCFERSLPERGLQELMKTQRLAEQFQDHSLNFLALREQLNYMANTGFGSASEQDVIDLQMSSKRSLKVLQQIHEHHTLYELLKFRLINHDIEEKKNRKEVNDLILGELSILNFGVKHQFESKKIHLLFQSFFLVHTRQYHSALNVFKDLYALIEENEDLWNYPPYDNLASFDGILENLHHMKFYDEMEFFISKLEVLYERSYPEHFKNLTYQTLCLYRLNMLVGKNEYQRAIEFSKTIHKELLINHNLKKTDKHLKLLLFTSVAFFHVKKFEHANKYLSYALNDNKGMYSHQDYRVCRLLHIVIHYQLKNLDYLEYEIRAFKRFYKRYGKSFRTEKLIFETIKANPKHSSAASNRLAYKKISEIIDEIRSLKHEEPFSNYIDLCGWVVSLFTYKVV